MNSENQAIKAPAKAGIKSLVNSPQYRAEFERLLGSDQMANRFVRVALTAFTKNPKLLQCEPATVFECLLTCAQFQLEPDGRHAHLIPRNNRKAGTVECTLIIDYKGLVTLAYRSGKVKSIHCDVIYEGDVFGYGLGRVVEHTPWWLRSDPNKPAKRGNCIGAYGVVELMGDAWKCEVMPESEIQSIRNRSTAGSSGPWVTDTDEMRKKTVFRRLSKWLPLSAEVIDAYESDSDKLPAIVHAKQTPRRVTLQQLQEQAEQVAEEEEAVDYVQTVAGILDAEEV
jgi:recombination protein RecT